MPATDRIATVKFQEKGEWTNVHQNVKQSFSRLYFIQTPEPRDSSKIVDDMRATAVAMQKIFKDAIAAGQRLRCLGGGWSLSDVAVTDGWLLSTKAMNLYWTMGKSEVHPDYKKDITGLYFVQCGMSVQELNDIVESDGKSLTTSGASNGQTIAGAIATGTHGSAYHFGAMPEYVTGFHLVTDDKVIWLERASCPVVSDAFVANLGAELKRDDDLFNAVLVSFGSFGIIAGVMIETEPKYLFEAQRIRVSLNDDLRNAMNTMTFKNIPLPHPSETPWHFEITFNPHDISGGGYVRTLYKRPYTDTYSKPVMPGGELGPGESLLTIIGSITQSISGSNVSKVMNELLKKNYPVYGPLLGTTGETFQLTTLKGVAMSMEMGIAMEDSAKVLDLMLGLTPEISSYAGVISYRWVKQSKATLGFTKFPVTATIEFNAAANDRTLAFYNRIWKELEAKGIPYTLHWGQMHNFTPERVKKMYGDAVVKWLTQRDLLLSPSAKAVFMSKFMMNTGLDATGTVPPTIV